MPTTWALLRRHLGRPLFALAAVLGLLAASLGVTPTGAAGTVGAAAEPPAVEALASDPAGRGPHPVRTSDYQLDPLPVEGHSKPIEMVGHVVEPAEEARTGPRPLVLFMHGAFPLYKYRWCWDPTTQRYGPWAHWPCRAPYVEVPLHRGYHYLQTLLASHGYTTVSVRVNGLNAQWEDWERLGRAEVVRAHLDHWAGLAAQHQIDLSRVVLVGHSEGGEGVALASTLVPADAQYRIVGQVLIAPTNTASRAAPYIPTAALLGYCDDIAPDLTGQSYVDAARDLTSDDTALRSAVFVGGANNQWFNTQMTPGLSLGRSGDDSFGSGGCDPAGEVRLSAEEQRAVAKAYVVGAVRLFAEGAEEFLPMFDGSAVRVPSVGDADVRSHALGGGRETRRPELDASLSPPRGAVTQLCRGITRDFGEGDPAGSAPDSCGRFERFDHAPMAHWNRVSTAEEATRFFEMSWSASGQAGGLTLARPLDLTGRRLEIRTIVDPGPGAVTVAVRLMDAAGRSAILTPVGGGLLSPLPLHYFRTGTWAQALRVEPAAATGVDLSAVTRVELVSRSARGRVWVADLSAAPAGLAPVADRRVPVVDLEDVTYPEGSGGASTAYLRYRIHGAVTRPGLFRVRIRDDRYRYRTHVVEVAPGQTRGSVPVQYDADEQDDHLFAFFAQAWGVRDMVAGNWRGSVYIEDDDPTPTVTVTPVDRWVREGTTAQLRIEFDVPPDYRTSVYGSTVPSPNPQLTGADLPAGWLDEHAYRWGEDDPLSEVVGLAWSAYLRPDQKGATLYLPVERDGLREPAESVTIRVDTDFGQFRRTFWVYPSP